MGRHTIYVLSTCDSCRAARRWLNEHGIDYDSFDVRKDGVDPDRLRQWSESLGWETLVNRRSRSWRSLRESEKSGMNQAAALRAIAEEPALMKRPLLAMADGHVEVGFTAERYAGLFSDG